MSHLLRPSARGHRPFTFVIVPRASASSQPQQQQTQPVAATPATPPLLRRDLLAALATLALAAPASAAENAAVTASLGRYVKRKKLDAIDSYVAPLLAAQDQLVRVGRVMVAAPADARELLRSGSFSGLRASVRAIGDYTAERGAGKEAGTALVTGFFKELEGLDSTLLNATRGREDPEEARRRLEGTLAALEKLLAAVPPEALDKARQVVGGAVAAGEAGEGAEVDAAELERLSKLL